MKILTAGRAQQGWSTEAGCTGAGNGDGGCGARLLVEQPDLYLTYSSSYDGTDDTFVTFTCPACGVQTDLRRVPAAVVRTLVSHDRWLAGRAEGPGP